MLFKQGAQVVTASGTTLGTVEGVIIDPLTKAVTHIVIRKGRILAQDKLIAYSLIDSATEDRITLREKSGDLEALPSFEVNHYVPLAPEDIGIDYTTGLAHPLFGYPPVVWDSYSTRNIPNNTVALRKGARVISSDDKYMGDVEQVFTDPKGTQATHFVISKGLLLKERKLIPTTWVIDIAEDEVQLAVSGNLLERLSPYEEPATV
jgi:uncharacterized protein YrrD